jgi:hypothetical protein
MSEQTPRQIVKKLTFLENRLQGGTSTPVRKESVAIVKAAQEELRGKLKKSK